MNIWEDLVDDGARFNCSITTIIDGEHWDCPRDADKAIAWDKFDELVKIFDQLTGITIRARAICSTHQIMIERDYLTK